MSIRALLVFGVLASALLAAPAFAQRARQADRPSCVSNYPQRSLLDVIFSAGPTPQANGCAPAVYDGGRFVGQDPDPNVRLQLRRDSDNEGYHHAR